MTTTTEVPAPELNEEPILESARGKKLSIAKDQQLKSARASLAKLREQKKKREEEMFALVQEQAQKTAEIEREVRQTKGAVTGLASAVSTDAMDEEPYRNKKRKRQQMEADDDSDLGEMSEDDNPPPVKTKRLKRHHRQTIAYEEPKAGGGGWFAKVATVGAALFINTLVAAFMPRDAKASGRPEVPTDTPRPHPKYV